ncbi:MAG: PKD domain-containing protein [Candidatus Brocadiae bacterium]|nr:PKD domain-containing protein [Candidatus Brocadiia bacterium]
MGMSMFQKNIVCLFLFCFMLFASPYQNISVAGSFNQWNPASETGKMSLVSGSHWEAVVYLSQGTIEYKFTANNSWATNWGCQSISAALPQKGVAVLQAGNIKVNIPANGNYKITFNDSTREFTLSYVGGNIPPVANAGADVAVVKGTKVVFDASASHDPDGSIVSYSWNNGLNGVTASKVYDQPGVYEVILTVTDNEGAVSTDSITVMVTKEAIADFRSETIYFLITTRFYDGDPSNNFYCRDRVKIGDPHWRGDFKGLIEKLDYIKDLGFTAIWITPPVENRSGLDYHGYHAYDWTKVDPRLESPEATYQDLIKAAHAKGLKIVQDVVINHSCNYGIRGKVWIDRLPIKYFRKSGVEFTWPYEHNLGNYLFPNREDNDNPVAPQWFRERQNSDPMGTKPLVDPKTGVTIPKNDYNPNRFFGIDANTLSVDWYHQDGFMSGGDWESPKSLQKKHMAGDCIDLATGRQNVKDYINQAINLYLDMGVDAIRLDTVKHVERNELLTYVNAWKAHKPGLFVFGENLVKGLGWGNLGGDNGPSEIRPWWYTRLGNDQYNPNSGGDSGFSVLDFSLFSTFRDNVSRGSFNGIGGVLGMDWVYGDPTTLVTFLQNHDVGPDNDFKYRFQGDQWMAAAAYNLLWTIRGIPCLYYGEEVEFMKGAPQDICGNVDTLDTTGRAYFGDLLENPGIQQHPLYQHIKRLNQIRKAIPALQKAPMSKVNEWGSGMSFVRDYNNGQSYAVVGLAIGSGQSITVGGVRNGTYKDAVTGATIAVNSGSISFQVKANSAGIWVLNGPGKIGTDGTYLK